MVFSIIAEPWWFLYSRVGFIWEKLPQVKLVRSSRVKKANAFIHIKNMEMEVAIFLPFHIFCFFRFLSGMYILWSLILIQTEQKFVVC